MTARHLQNRAVLLVYAGRQAEAADAAREALEIRLKTLGEDHVDSAMAMANLAAIRYFEKSFQEAESLFRRAVAILERQRESPPREMAVTLLNFSRALRRSGKKAEGKQMESQANAILALNPSARGGFTVDITELLSHRR